MNQIIQKSDADVPLSTTIMTRLTEVEMRSTEALDLIRGHVMECSHNYVELMHAMKAQHKTASESIGSLSMQLNELVPVRQWYESRLLAEQRRAVFWQSCTKFVTDVLVENVRSLLGKILLLLIVVLLLGRDLPLDRLVKFFTSF